MECNVGKPEGFIRILIGFGIIAAGILFENWWGLLGIGLIATGVIGWCPINKIFGFSSCKQQK